MDERLTVIRTSQLRFFPGARFGLTQKTALLVLAYEGTIADLPAFDRTMAALLDAVNPALAKPFRWPLEARTSAAGRDGPDGMPLAIAYRTFELILLMLRWAREPVFQGRTLRAEPGRLTLAMPWFHETVFRSTVAMALRLVALAAGGEAGNVDNAAEIGPAFARWLRAAQDAGLSPMASRLAGAALRRDHPVESRWSHLQVGWAAGARRLHNTMTGATYAIAVRAARHKHVASQILAEAGVPVPAFAMVASADEAATAAEAIGWPVVVKPSDQDGGVAVATDIRDTALLRRAFAAANAHSPNAVMVERHISGDDHRLLIVGGRMLIATRRTPGGITGDGSRSVADLLQALNDDPRRGQHKQSMLIRIALDEEARECLREQALAPDSVPAAGRFVRLRRAANISIGGTAEDVTAQVHPDNRALAIRAARVIGLDIAGVDFLCPDIARSWREVGGAICEVNAQPTLRVHWLGDPSRDLDGEIVDWLTRGRPTRIPTAAIAGTRGKRLTARMLHHIWMVAGRKTAGLCTSKGMWVGGERVSERDLAGFPGARALFADPLVEAAVIEVSRASLLQFGHPCDRYDVAALLNVRDEGNDADGIHSLEDVAALKAEVLERARRAAVINADDPNCLAVRERSGSRSQILVSQRADSEALRAHLATGGAGAFLDQRGGEPWIVLAMGAQESAMMPLAEIPAAAGGAPHETTGYALFAIAIAWAQGLPLPAVRQAIAGFAA